MLGTHHELHHVRYTFGVDYCSNLSEKKRGDFGARFRQNGTWRVLSWFASAPLILTFGASRVRAMLALATERRQNKSFQFSERGRARPTAPRRARNGGGRDPIAITTATATEHATATA